MGLILGMALATYYLSPWQQQQSGGHGKRQWWQPEPVGNSVLNPLTLGLCGLLILALLQTVELPHAMWQAISSTADFQREVTILADGLQEQLPTRPALQIPGLELAKAEELPVAQTVSIHPLQTRASAAVFACAIAMLVAAGILFHGHVGNLLLLLTIALTALANTLLGLCQSVAWNHWSLLEMPTPNYFSTFVSRNTAPQYLAIGLASAIGLLTYWMRSKDSHSKRHSMRYPASNSLARMRRRVEEGLQELDLFGILLILAMTFLFAGIIASSSRGGILASSFAVVATLALSSPSKDGSRLRWLLLLSLIAVAGYVVLSILDLNVQALDRLQTISAEAYQLDNGRLGLWKMALSQSWYWWAGCGLGAFHFAILPCYSGTDAVWFYHAENIFVEMWVEFGCLGFCLGLLSLAWLVRHIIHTRHKYGRRATLIPAMVFALTAIGLQSLVDFSLIIPAVFLTLAALLGCFLVANSQTSLPPSPAIASSRTFSGLLARSLGSAPLALCVMLLAFAMLHGFPALWGFAAAEQLNRQIDTWQASRRAGQPAEVPQVSATPQLLLHPEFALALARLEQEFFAATLAESIVWPAEASPRSRMQLSLPETVAAAMRGGPQGKLAAMSSILEQESALTTELAMTSLRMSQAIAACPFDWRASWGLLRSDLSQLSSADRARNYARLALVTKHHPNIQVATGTTAMWAGEVKVGIPILRRAWNANPRLSRQMIALTGELFNPQELLEILPDSNLERIRVAEAIMQGAQRRPVEEDENLALVDVLLRGLDIPQAMLEAQSAEDWKKIAWMWLWQAKPSSAIEALQQALAKSPMDHELRFELVKLLRAEGRVEDAQAQMDIVRRRAPLQDEYRKYLRELEDN